MKVIYKGHFIIKDGLQIIPLSKGAEIIHVATHIGLRDDRIPFWFVCDPDKNEEGRHFIIKGTGHPFDHDNYTHLGTVTQDNGTFIWHVLEINN